MCKPDSYKINAKVAATFLLLVTVGFAPAQQPKGGPVTVASVSSHPSANGTVVSIVADGPLNRAQTWQDREGYHVVVPSAGTQNAIKAGSGIKVRQLDRSLEIVIQTKPGANVTVQPTANRLNLNVEGKLEPRGSEAENTTAAADKSRTAETTASAQTEESKALRSVKASPLDTSAADARVAAERNQSSSQPATTVNPAPPSDGQSQKEMAMGESSVMSGVTLLIGFGLVCVGGLLLLRRRRAAQATVTRDDDGFEEFGTFETRQQDYADVNRPNSTRAVQEGLMKSNGSATNGSATQRKSLARMPVAMPAALFGAYQVDLEVAKLVQGQPHRMDVVASRAPDDRRAIEASLLKTLTAAAGDEDIQRRARGALDEYGFVARQSATLLMSSDPYERTSAARMLGDAKAPSSLPFLLEALYDHESLVRNQAVLSIGELRMPSAIGALLDIARKHPDVPGSLLSRALSACSLEGLDFFDAAIPEPRLLPGVDTRLLVDEIMNLEPAAGIEELPESADDETFVRAVALAESETITDRSEAIKLLAQFSVRSSVSLLARIARTDPESSLRAAAISGLAFVNHESVFPAILIAMADESREVRAAAARSLSRLSFDRADAYIRVTQTDDADSLRDVADACVKAGIAAQGMDRISSGDHQAYEAMSVVSLLLKANKFEPLLDVIANHPNLVVRLIATHLLGLTGQPSLVEPLQQLMVDSQDEVKDALEAAIARLAPAQREGQDDVRKSVSATAAPEFEGEPQSDFASPSESESQSHAGTEPEEFVAVLENAQGSESETLPEYEVSAGYDFEFAPAQVSEPGSEPLQLERSGLPTPPIA
jgi:HEAT repeat protein